jgi:hypothetical protein
VHTTEYRCWDNLEPYRRPALIARILESPEDEPELTQRADEKVGDIFF